MATPTPTQTQTPSAPEAVGGQSPTPTTSPQVNVAQSSAGEGNNEILNAINDYRVSKGLGRVVSNAETCSFAKTRAGEISANFNHDGFTQRIASHNLPYTSYSLVTENIAENSDSSQIVNMWINSPSHEENIRKDTPYVCIVQNGNYFAYEGWKP